jgi:hypothetical protein
VAERLETHAYSIAKAHHAALSLLGEQDGRRGASEVLREIFEGNADTLAAFRELVAEQQKESAA